MNRLRLLFIGAAALVFAIFFAGPVLATIRTQQAQIGITIIVNVTPNPLGYAPRNRPANRATGTIAANMSVHKAPMAFQHLFHADSLHFIGGSTVLAQAQVQHGVLVQAEVTPNPNATLLYSGTTSNPVTTVTINAEAGSTVTVPCAFTITVDSAKSWSLEQGLSNDFTTGWNGNTLANNTYLSAATPQPTATPYAVYADDGGVWTIIGAGTSMTTYCVGLTLTIPIAIPGGTYSTNAIYTEFQ